MGKLRITEETSARLVLEKVNPISATWKEWRRYLINPLLLLAIMSYFYFVAKISLNGFFWVIAIGVFLAEALFLSIILTSERKRIVTIDVSSKKAMRIEKLIIGLERKKELALEKVSRILIQCEQVDDHCVLELDTQSNHPLVVASNFDLRGLPSDSRTNTSLNLNNDEIEIRSLESLGIKISKLLMKPVKSKVTEKGNPHFRTPNISIETQNEAIAALQKTAQHSVHPNPDKVRRGHGGGCVACRPQGRRAHFQAVCVAQK